MANVWRIHLIKDIPTSPNYGNYCLNNKVAAMGWILEKYNDDIKAGKIKIETYSDYANYAAKCFDKFDDVRRLAEDIKPGDFIWTCVDKNYYLAKVSDKSHYRYNFSDEAIYYRACNELTNIEWKCIEKSFYKGLLKRVRSDQTLYRIFDENDPKFNDFAYKYSDTEFKGKEWIGRIPLKPVNLTRQQLEEHARKKFCWHDGEVVAFKNREDLEEQAKKEGGKVVWY